MSKRLIAMFAGALAIALIAAGCGGSSSDSSTSSLTKAQFINQADAICASGNKELEAEFQAYGKKNGLKENQEPTEAQGTEIAETILIPSVKTQVKEIRALGAPSGEENTVNTLLDAVEEAIEKAEEEPSALVSENNNLFAKANTLARKYGLKVCGEE